MVISFVLFPKALNWKYIAGFIAVLVSTVYTFYLKSEKRQAKAAAKAAASKAAKSADAVTDAVVQ